MISATGRRLEGLLLRSESPFGCRPIFYNSCCDVWACRAFKRSFVVIRLIRLNTGEPHLSRTEFTQGATDNRLLGNCLIFSHPTPFVWLAWHPHKLKQ